MGLLAVPGGQKVGAALLGFFREGGFEDAGARAAEPLRVGKCERLCFPGGVLLDGEERWCAAAFDEYFANAMAGSLGRDHGNIDGCGRLNRAEANIEAVREH